MKSNKEVTLIIKTFIRIDCVVRLLKSIKRYANGYPIIIWIRICTHPKFGFALTNVKKTPKYEKFLLRFRICTHCKILKPRKTWTTIKFCG